MMNENSPLLRDEDIPEMYLIPTNNHINNHDNQPIKNIEDPADNNISFSYTNLMSKFSKIAMHAKSNKKIHEYISYLFEKLNLIKVTNDAQSLIYMKRT